MRPIKFRAWDTKRKEWYGASDDSLLTFYGFSLFGECTYFCNPPVSEIGNIEITQFTGILDKNGKEIYEGDILNIGDDHEYQKNLIVKWSEKECAFIMDNGTTRSFSFISTEHPIVIGNIFENPIF